MIPRNRLRARQFGVIDQRIDAQMLVALDDVKRYHRMPALDSIQHRRGEAESKDPQICVARRRFRNTRSRPVMPSEHVVDEHTLGNDVALVTYALTKDLDRVPRCREGNRKIMIETANASPS